MRILTNQSLEHLEKDLVVLLPKDLCKTFWKLRREGKLGEAVAFLYRNNIDPTKLTFCSRAQGKLVDYIGNEKWGIWCLCCGALEKESVDIDTLLELRDEWPILLSPSAEILIDLTI